MVKYTSSPQVCALASKGSAAASAKERADRTAPGNRAINFVRGAIVALSVILPLLLVGSAVLAGKGPFGVNVPEATGALVALALVIGVSIAAVRS